MKQQRGVPDVTTYDLFTEMTQQRVVPGVMPENAAKQRQWRQALGVFDPGVLAENEAALGGA